MQNNHTQFRVLVVGVGSIGERHVRCLLKTGRAGVGIAETNQDLCLQIANRYDLKHAFPSLEHAWRLHWDAAVIATPAPTHVPIARTLASVGTHLLIEKPISTSLDGIEDLQETIQRRRLTAGVAYTLRSHPVLARLRERVKSGELGAPLQLIFVAGQDFPTFRPAYRETYYARRSAGGGAIQDALTHLLNAGEWILGPIHRVAADASHQKLEGVDVEDTVHVLARHDDVMACYILNQHQHPNESTLTVICERGTIRAELHEMRVREMHTPNAQWADEVMQIPDRDDLYVRQLNEFFRCIEEGTQPLCTIDEATQTLRVVQEVLKCVDGKFLRVVSSGDRALSEPFASPGVSGIELAAR